MIDLIAAQMLNTETPNYQMLQAQRSIRTTIAICLPKDIEGKRVSGNMIMDKWSSAPRAVKSEFRKFKKANPQSCIDFDTKVVSTFETNYSRDVEGATKGARYFGVTLYYNKTNPEETGELRKYIYTPGLEAYLNSLK